jgi:hypothetical protein
MITLDYCIPSILNSEPEVLFSVRCSSYHLEFGTLQDRFYLKRNQDRVEIKTPPRHVEKDGVILTADNPVIAVFWQPNSISLTGKMGYWNNEICIAHADSNDWQET